MNVLVTNAQMHAAYAIMLALKPFSENIVTTTPVKIPKSRLAKRQYRVPVIEDEWRSGRISRENTDREEAYVRMLMDICRREAIDVVFPSYDPQVYVLSKNMQRFQEAGVLIPVVDYDTLLGALDKYRTVRVAEGARFPRPGFCLADSRDALENFIDRFGPPWVIRPRFTAGSKGMRIVSTREALFDGVRRVTQSAGVPMVQEYIPGSQKQNFYLFVGRDQELLSVFCPKILRYSFRLYRNSSAACLFGNDHPLMPQVEDLVREMGWYGAMTLQTKIDVRDGIPKLMEVNPRLGSNLWYRTELGINVPMMAIELAGEETVRLPSGAPAETMLLDPIDDICAFGFDFLDSIAYRIKKRWKRGAPIDPENSPAPLKSLIRSYLSQYNSSYPKKYHPHFRYALEDPAVFLWRVIGTFKFTASRLRHIGI